MTHRTISAFALLTALAVLLQPTGAQQQPFQPAVPSSSSFNAYGGFYDGGASTAEESAMRGMASVISARGDAALSTSAAAVNLTQAEKQDIENRQAATTAYFEMQETNRAYRDARRSPRLSHEQYVRIAASAAPKKLSTNEIDAVAGRINWPELLQLEPFAEERGGLDKLCTKYAQYGTLGLSDHMAAGKLIDAMNVKLKGMVSKVPAQHYVAAKNFLKSLMFAMTKTQLG
jgi:hypothetical protein